MRLDELFFLRILLYILSGMVSLQVAVIEPLLAPLSVVLFIQLILSVWILFDLGGDDYA